MTTKAVEEPRRLGLVRGTLGRKPPAATSEPTRSGWVNTRTSLWPDRWPAIALQVCIDEVEAAPPGLQAQVKWDLPCSTCSESPRCLNAKRKEIGPLMYDREILTKPRSGESSLLPRELFEPLLAPREHLVPHYRKPFSVEHRYKVAQAWDLAWSERTGGDYLVHMAAVVDLQTGLRTLLDVQRWQRLTFTNQVKLIESQWRAYAGDVVVIETDAAQSVWRQRVEETSPVPVVPHGSGSKTDLAAGVPGLLILLQAQKWSIPYAQGLHRDEVDNFLDECEAFSWVDGKLQGVGEHDDTVMCFWHLNHGIDMLLNPVGGTQHRIGTQPGRTP